VSHPSKLGRIGGINLSEAAVTMLISPFFPYIKSSKPRRNFRDEFQAGRSLPEQSLDRSH
jgi:hypothetical protein